MVMEDQCDPWGVLIAIGVGMAVGVVVVIVLNCVVS